MWLASYTRHADAGRAWAQSVLGTAYRDGRFGAERSLEKAAVQLKNVTFAYPGAAKLFSGVGNLQNEFIQGHPGET